MNRVQLPMLTTGKLPTNKTAQVVARERASAVWRERCTIGKCRSHRAYQFPRNGIPGSERLVAWIELVVIEILGDPKCRRKTARYYAASVGRIRDGNNVTFVIRESMQRFASRHFPDASRSIFAA